jgi:pilus assembly protein CpaB
VDKGRIIRLVLIPIVAGLIVTLVAQGMMTKSQQAATAPVVETVPVVVVASQEPIPARTKIVETQLAVRQLPRELATGTEYADPKDVVGKIAMIELQSGEIIRQGRVVEEGQGRLPYRVPEGKRAVTLRLDELNGVAGHPEIGDLVDLILFLPEKPANKEQGIPHRPASARILYEGVLVLDKGPAQEEAAGAKGPAKPGESKLTSITLALTPQAATEVALAEQIGHIKLVLRPALKQPDAGPVKIWDSKYLPAPGET